MKNPQVETRVRCSASSSRFYDVMWDILRSEPGIRLSCFFGVLVTMAAWEIRAPRRVLTASQPLRWLSHFALVVVNSLLVRLVAPLGVVSAALLAETRGWGLLTNATLPYGFEVIVCVVAFDLAVYLQLNTVVD